LLGSSDIIEIPFPPGEVIHFYGSPRENFACSTRNRPLQLLAFYQVVASATLDLEKLENQETSAFVHLCVALP